MSTSIKDPQDANLAAILGESQAEPRWLRQVDAWAKRAGDAINPILIKETRQALKSRQFVVTFSLLLFAALSWTIVGSLFMMPQIYFLPSGPTMLVGYYLVLAVPMLLVVPLAAYRSLEGEIDDGTLELLSVTSLSPRQIVFGKLGSAALQMMLYFVALFPCVAYAYTLRGIDLPTLAILMAMLIVSGLTLTVVAIFFAPMARARSTQVSTLLCVMGALVLGEVAVGSLAIGLIQEGNPLPAAITVFVALSVILFAISFSGVLVMATAAQLTPESENRSTAIRVALLAHMLVLVGIASHSQFIDAEIALGTLILILMYVNLLWLVVGSMMCAESSTMTPRIRRELPGTFLGRLFLIWFTPGPATGFVFSLALYSITLCVLGYLLTLIGVPYANRLSYDSLLKTLSLVVSYLCIAFVGVRVIVKGLRARNSVRVGIGLAASVVVLLLMALAPYSIELHLNDYRPYSYSMFQLPNWIWTLYLSLDGMLPDYAYWWVQFAGASAFIIHLVVIGRVVLPNRLVTPQRVIEERNRRKGIVQTIPETIDPLAAE